MDALFHLRDMIASLDVPLTDDLCARARLPRNDDLYALNGAAAPAPEEARKEAAPAEERPARKDEKLAATVKELMA